MNRFDEIAIQLLKGELYMKYQVSAEELSVAILDYQKQADPKLAKKFAEVVANHPSVQVGIDKVLTAIDSNPVTGPMLLNALFCVGYAIGQQVLENQSNVQTDTLN